MQALEAVRLAPDPQQIPERFQRITEIEVAGVKAGPVADPVADPVAGPAAGVAAGVAAQRRTLPGVEDLVAACADRLALFSEVGAGWSEPSLARQSPAAEQSASGELGSAPPPGELGTAQPPGELGGASLAARGDA
jgi:hypothetical protein